MTIQLDLRTLLIINTLIKVAQALAMLYVWRIHRHYPPVKYWTFGSFFIAAGVLLVAARDLVPLWLSVIIANSFLIPGWILFDIGFIRAAGRTVPWRSGFFIMIAALISLTWFSAVTPDYVARLITFSIAVLISDGYTVYVCMKYSESGKVVTFRIIGFSIILIMISGVWRMISGINLNLSSILSPTIGQTQFFIILILFSVIMTTLLVLLTAQQLQEEINLMSQQLIHQSEVERDYAQISAMTDGLTRLANRRHFDEALHREFFRHKRSGAPLSLIMMDVDHFKTFNDTYGHIAGDDCLKLVAKAIKTVAGRAHDMVARYGGEEFCVILPETDSRRAAVLAGRMRKAVEKLSIPHEASDTAKYVTVSLGIVTVSAAGIAAPESVVDMADKALYRAKHCGRNRAEIAHVETDLSGSINDSNSGLVKLVWHATYECGNTVIDTQHKKLFDDANRLLSAVVCSSPKGECSTVIEELLGDITGHFRAEEDIFCRAGYPYAEEHRKLHENLVSIAAVLAEKYRDDKLTMGELFSFLAYDVVAQHMFIEDRKFFPYI